MARKRRSTQPQQQTSEDNNRATVERPKGGRKRLVRSDSDVNEKVKTKTSKKAKTSRQSTGGMCRLSRHFFTSKSAEELAKALLGQTLCRRLSPKGPVLKGRIVETEAYLGAEDKASATYNGRRTEHLEPLYMTAGTCFVYMTYGMYHCINLSALGDGHAVLLRAVQPVEGLDDMQRLRAKSRKDQVNAKPFAEKLLANGPSKLCMAFGIDKNNTNKSDITDSDVLWIESGDAIPDEDIVSTGRVGIPKALEWTNKPLRFYIKDNQFISKK